MLEGGAARLESGITYLQMDSQEQSASAPLLEYRDRDWERTSFKGSETLEKIVEAKRQFVLGAPVFLVAILDFGTTCISVAFVGHLGTKYLAGASMGSSLANVTGFALLEGLASGMETSGGQAFGSGKSHVLGHLLQRGQFVLLMVALAITLIWLHASQILCLIGQDPEIAALAQGYVLHLLPGLFFTALYLPVTKFITVQGSTKPLAVVAGSVMVLHGPICWLYVNVLNLGYTGAALATCTSNFLMLTLLVLYLNLESSGILSRSWSGWSLAALDNLVPFLCLALPACAMIVFEWWSWEILQLMAGWLPNPAVAVSSMTISFFTVATCFTVGVGIAAAASIRVSNELGAQNPENAKKAAKVTLICAVVTGCFLGLLALVFGKYWAKVFVGSSDPEVVKNVVSLLPFVTASIIALTLSTAMSGILRGSGQQLAGSIVNGLSLYGVGIPLAYFLGVRMAWEESGFWTGMTIALFLQLTGLGSLAARTDWEGRSEGLL